jgi:ureidoglycolate lyase
MKIKAQKLTQEVFEGFGQVLMGSGAGPERKDYAAKIDNKRASANPNMSFMRVTPSNLPIHIDTMERHEYSNQVFIPMNGTFHLVVVCPQDTTGKPDVEKMIAFVANGSQAVNYNTGTWHAPRTVVRGPGEFIMFRWDDGSDLDTEQISLDEMVEIEL